MGTPHTLDSLSHIDFYMYDVTTEVQGWSELQCLVFYGTARDLKWIFPSLPGKTKELVSVKKLRVGEGNWTCVN